MKLMHARPIRFAWLSFALLICLGTVAARQNPQALAEDWPRWRGVRGDGTWQAPEIAEKWPAGGLNQVWTTPVGGGYAGVIVVGNRVLTMDRQKEPTNRERVICLDATSGEPLWTHEYAVEYTDLTYDSGPRAAPTVHEGRVYTLGAVGHVHCLELETGNVLWSKDSVAEGAKRPEWGFAASPLIYKHSVIVHVAMDPAGSLMALDQKSGKEIWRAAGDPAGYATPILIDRADAPQIVAWTPENVLGIHPETGVVEWSIPYPVTYGVSIATPIWKDDLVLVSGYWEGTKAIRLGKERTDATLAWEENKFLRGLMSQPLQRGEHVYSLDKRFGVTCFEWETGKKLWDDGNTLTPRGSNPQASLVWLGDSDRCLALNAEGELILAKLRPSGYEELARAKIIGPTWAHPGYAGSRVYARDDQALICVELPLAEMAR